ncbi:MAG: hypothetical protein MUF43_13460 [Flavobacterium sp.]|nr:hypothetical protein [Flavobacterium sp.]
MTLLKNRLINFLIIILFGPLLLFSQKKGDLYYKEALKLIEKDKNFEEANVLLDKAIEKDSTNRDYLILKSKILFSKSDCSNSLRYLQKVILLDKKFSDSTAVFFSDLADCLKDNSTAIEVLKDYLNKNNSDIVKIKLAQKYFLNKKYEESIVLYKEFVNDNPRDIDAIIDLTRLLFSFKSQEDAIIELKKGLNTNPNNVKLLIYLASCYHNMKKYEDAICIENLIIKIEYKAEHIASRAMLYELQGKRYDAYEDYKKIIELNKCNLEFYTKTLQYEFENRFYEKVIQNSFKLIECDKKNEEIVLDGLYTSLFFCGEIDKGMIYLDKRLELKPNTFNPYYLKALILLRNGQYENVLEYFNLALKAKDIDKENVVQINLLKFGYYLLKEDYEGFVSYWKSGNIKTLDNNLNFTFIENHKAEKVEIKIDFNKGNGIINSTMIIPTKVFVLLKDKYGLN